MSAQNKKERKKQQRTKRKRREMLHRKKGQVQAKTQTQPRTQVQTPSAATGESLFKEPNTSQLWRQAISELGRANDIEADGPVDSEQDDDPLSIWWREFDAADGAARLHMVREKLEVLSPDDEDYEHVFPEAVHDLEGKLSSEEYVAFLEELVTAHPANFAMGADWHTTSMVSEYLDQNRMQDVDRVVMSMAEGMKEIGGPFFALVSTLRLAGRTDASQAMVDAAAALLDDSDLMPRAVGDILDWALFPHYQRCVADGATDASIEAVRGAARNLGIEDSEKYQENRRNFALHLSGQSTKQWTQSELLADEDETGRRLYLLGADFMRWMCEERQFKPVVADELRILVNNAIDGLDRNFRGIAFGMSRREFESFLGSLVGFMSLKRVQAPATIIAMKHYVDFLKEIEVTKPGDWQKSQSVCDSLWKKLKKSFGEEWKHYRFLEAYLPAS